MNSIPPQPLAIANHLLPPLVAGFLASAAGMVLAETTYADIAPVIQQRCVMCHGGPSPAAGLALGSLDSLLKGSAKGPVVKAGAPADSELIRRLKGTSLPRMPLTGPPFLAAAEITLIESWIAGGLKAGAPATVAAAPAAPPRPAAGEPVTYVHVAPIFATRCTRCHTEKGQMGPPPEGYKLNGYDATTSTLDRVRIVPGDPEASELVRRVRGQALPRMPHDGPPYLADEEIALIEAWVAQGARNAEGKAMPMPVGAAVRLHGKLTSKGGLEGLDLVAGPRMRVDKNPRTGTYVQVRGHINEAGQVVVDRLRAR